MNRQTHALWARVGFCLTLGCLAFPVSQKTFAQVVTPRVMRVNALPVADAGPDQSANVGATVTLDGSNSSTPPLTYGWLQTGGPAVSLSDATAAMPTFAAPATPTVITFTLIVTDTSDAASLSDEVVVTLNDIGVTNLSASNSSPTFIGQTTVFTAAYATGSNVSFLWDFGDGNSALTQNPTHIYALPGAYTAIVTASNSAGLMGMTTAVQIVNRPPVAAIGASTTLTVKISELGNLDASGSSDPDEPPPFAYAYFQTGGPGVTLQDGSYQTTGFIGPSDPTTLTFLLLITDTYGLTGTTTINVNVINRPITWVAATNDSPTALGNSTVFTGFSTGSNVGYVWDFGDGSPVVAGFSQVHSYANYGTYNAVMTATNTEGSLSSGTLVKILNPYPTANAGANQSVPVNTTATLDGSGSNDLNGDVPLTYLWAQTGGPLVTLTSRTVAMPSFLAPATPSILTFTLAVTDSTGLRALADDSVTLFVSDGTILGLEIQTDEPSYLSAATHFTAALGAGTNVTYVWSFGDGGTGSGVTPTHAYAGVGSYWVMVTATNSLGNATAAKQITLTNPAPVANAGVDQVVTVSSTVILSGGLSSDANNNLPLQYHWSQVGGPSVNLVNANTATPLFMAPAFPATLTFQLVVTDSFGLSNVADTMVVQVKNNRVGGLTAQANTPTLLGSQTAFVASLNNGSNVVYQWAFGDGSSGSGIAPTHVYTSVGIFKAIVTATNDLGSLVAFVNVEVKNLPPTVKLSATTLAVNSGARFTLDGSTSFDPNNNVPLSYRWQQAGGFQVVLSTPNAMTTSANAPRVTSRTTLTFTLTVIDAVGAASIPGVVVVTVSPLHMFMPLAKRG